MEVNKLLDVLVNEIANKVITGLLAKMNTAEAITQVNNQLKTVGSGVQIAEKPVATKPEVTKPVVTKPVVTKPVVTKPVATKPVVTEPVATEPVATKPVALELADIRVVAVSLKRAGKNVKKLIQSFGVEKLSDIKPEKRAEFLAAAEEMQGEK